MINKLNLPKSLGSGILLLALLSLTVVFIGGCGGGSDSSPAQNIKLSSRIEKPGDVITYQDTIDVKFSNGNTLSGTTIDVETFSKIDSIPSKYSYSGKIIGPYILNTITEDGVLDGEEYISLLGTVIIDDGLDTFTRIDDQTSSGSDEPDNVSTGDVFSYSEESRLFDSNTGADVGNNIISGTFTVKKATKVTVPAGSFEVLQIDFVLKITEVEKGSTIIADFTGSGWWSFDQGLMVK